MAGKDDYTFTGVAYKANTKVPIIEESQRLAIAIGQCHLLPTLSNSCQVWRRLAARSRSATSGTRLPRLRRSMARCSATRCNSWLCRSGLTAVTCHQVLGDAESNAEQTEARGVWRGKA